jgi:transposase InsO family protein
MNSQIEGFLEEEGIKHEFSSPYTPQQNGVVERNNRTLSDMARTMIDESKTPDRFWVEAINTACYSINRLYLHRILKKTSYELLTGKKPNVSYFRVFGSKCFILIKRGRKSKFAPKAVEGFLLGYDSNTRALESSTNPLDWLRFLVTLCLMRLMAPKWSKLILMN